MLEQQVTSLTFEQATIRAESYVGHEEKLRCLLKKATRKSEQCYEFLLAPWESLQIFLRLLRAHLAGKFHTLPDSILMLVAAVVYFVSPLDLVPDSIPVLGLIERRSCGHIRGQGEPHPNQQFPDVGNPPRQKFQSNL